MVAAVGKRRLMLQEVESRIPVQLAGKVGVQGKRRLVEGWVEEELFYQEALQRKLDKDPVVAARISDAVRDMLVAEFLEQEFKRDSDVLEGEVLDYYEAHRDDFVRELPEIRARHILVSNRDALNRVWQRLQDGDPFERIARAESIDSSSEDGGGAGLFYGRSGRSVILGGVPEGEGGAAGVGGGGHPVGDLSVEPVVGDWVECHESGGQPGDRGGGVDGRSQGADRGLGGPGRGTQCPRPPPDSLGVAEAHGEHPGSLPVRWVGQPG